MLHSLTVTLWWANVGLSIPMCILGMIACYWTTYAWHSPENHDSTRAETQPSPPRYRFSLIIPVRNEIYAVMSETVRYALAQTHPRVQIVISVGHDDPETKKVARQIIAEYPHRGICLSISPSDVHNKPTQLNAALKDCAGDIVGVLDAESVSAPDLLAQVDALFQREHIEVVQGGVMLTNFHSSFVSLRSSLEYYAHHRSKMHFSSGYGAILMGGNTVFFKRSLLEQLGGWDERNLAEDAEISIRLQTTGRTIAVAYAPNLVTREEAPITIKAWTKQRTRWNLGFLQTLRKGVWKELPSRKQRIITVWHLCQPAVMALTGLCLPLALFTAFTHPPLGIAMLTWLPAVPTLFMVAIEMAMLASLDHEHNCDVRIRDYVKLLVTTPIYTLMMIVAAVRAAWRYGRQDLSWEKTAHVGLHLPALAEPVAAEPAAPVRQPATIDLTGPRQLAWR